LLIESRDLEPGTVIRGKYRIVRRLGRGGMGTVYLADHILLSRQRALKFISAELSQDPRFLKRFRHEAQAASELRHQNVVEVVDLDQAEDGSPYIAMEYVEGTDLRHALAAGAFPVSRALRIARGVALGLGAAHAKGIFHRDVKPENILLAGANGPQETPKLLDFGIAAMKESATAISRTGGVMLTPDYAAPEQWRGMASEELDGRVDMYALGGVLYEMLTGRTPFEAQNIEGWMYQHLHKEAEPPSRLRPELANWPGVDALVLCLLAKDREQRPKDAGQLARLIEAAWPANGANRPRTQSEAPLPANQSVSPKRSRFRFRKWLILLVAVILAGLGSWYAAKRFPTSMFTTAVPVLTPSGGTYAEPQAVAISDAAPNAIIYYTVDGSLPTEASTIYTKPVSSLPSGAVLRAIAKAGWHMPSPEVRGVYVWSRPARVSSRSPGEIAFIEGKTAFDHKDFAQARTLFDQACSSGEMKACNYLGYLYAQGLGGERDPKTAREVYQKACDKGTLSSCASLGSLYQDAGNNGEARNYYKKACDGGLAEACELLRAVQ
jgi:serine/threonine-protein kinase